MMELTAWPPRLGWLSTRITFRPIRAASSAAEIPEIPAPTTQTSPEMRIEGESFDLMEIFVGRLAAASLIILDAPSTFERSGSCQKWSNSRTALPRMAELYHLEFKADEISNSRDVRVCRTVRKSAFREHIVVPHRSSLAIDV